MDTGELLDIADGRADETRVDLLVSAMRTRGFILIVSKDHLQDALGAGDPMARERLAASLERFTLRAVVMKEPHEIEPWEGTRGDIEIASAGNIRELVMAPEAVTYLAPQWDAQDAIHIGAVAGQQAIAASRTVEFRRKPDPQLFVQALVTLARGWAGHEVEPVVRFWEERLGASLTPEGRAIVVGALLPYAEIFRATRPVMDRRGIDPVEVLRRAVTAGDETQRARAPGTFLAAKLTAARAKNVGRQVLRSDVVDLSHAAYLPYVDVATVDRQAYATLKDLVGAVSGPRRTRLFRNGQLDKVIEEVLRFPEYPP